MKERLGLYGGTFAPPHLGHVRAAENMMTHLGLDRLLIMPTNVPPHKIKTAQDTPGQRLAMCHAAFDGIAGAEVSDFEIRQGGASYTYLTLEHLTSPEREIFMLCGSDMLLTLDQWRRAEDIFRMANIVCMPRYTDGIGALTAKQAEYREKYGARVEIIPGDVLEISSTEIRQRIAENGDLTDLLPADVIDIIRRENLYGE
ncbi:MAG: nicotinate (nicotinamide) nucleotide adenylyltransferase [Clostridia bacterium]|nr:nicotinate (nicotinamide) nucleotide adenylyltransferase [Clostridia bacterium]